jgi:cardiolipin synthase
MELVQVPRRFRLVQERFVEGNRVALLRDGAEAFPAMLDAIAAARRQVLLEMYWFDSEQIGQRFAVALADAAARGVEVCLIYDALGSIDADDDMFTELERAGIAIVEYNPVVPWRRRFRLGLVGRRDHRKILVVDGALGFTGGINISDAWLPEEQGGGGWRDDVVRIDGPAVEGLVELFARTWVAQGGRPLRQSASRGSVESAGEHRVKVLGGTLYRNRRDIVHAYVANVWRARRRVWIKNSYFVPDPIVTRALKRAALRGVDVRVVVPGKIDVWIVRHASRAMWGGLMAAGVRIFEWQRNVLHSKTAVIDGIWSTIGTLNLDYLSLFSSLEVNVAIQDERFGALMEASFVQDLEQCSEVDPYAFRFRPLGARLLELVLYRFRKLM